MCGEIGFHYGVRIIGNGKVFVWVYVVLHVLIKSSELKSSIFIGGIIGSAKSSGVLVYFSKVILELLIFLVTWFLSNYWL